MPGTEYKPESCNLFIAECDKNQQLSSEQLFKALIGVDENGCPFLKTNGPTAAQVVELTDAITALTAAINAM